MFKHYCVILREFIVSTLLSYTSMLMQLLAIQFEISRVKIYILRGFKTSDDAFRLSHSIAFDCSIRPFLDLFHSWLFIFHLSRFSGDGLVFSFLQVSSES